MCEVFCLICVIAKYNKVVPAGTSDARHQYYDKGEFFVSKQPQLITMHSSKQRVGCMHQLRSRAFGIAKRSFPKLLTTTPSCMNVYILLQDIFQDILRGCRIKWPMKSSFRLLLYKNPLCYRLGEKTLMDTNEL